MSQTVSAFLLKNLQVKSRSGFEWLCLCPYHEDNSPSFSFNIKKRLFVCFACGAKGNLRQLMEHLGVKADVRGEEKSIEELADKISATKSILFEDPSKRPNVGVPYPLIYKTAKKEIEEFWGDSRGLNRGQIQTYELGYDVLNDHAIIPIRDPESGVVMSLIRRRRTIEDGQSRYLYSKGAKISEMVFGAYEARKYVDAPSVSNSTLIITEGAIDAMTPFNIYPVRDRVIIGGVAILGSRMSKTQGEIIRSIGARNIIIVTDMDRAGRIAQTQIATMLKDLKCGSIIYKAEWDGKKYGKDLNEVYLGHGINTVRGILEETITARPIPNMFTPPRSYKEIVQELNPTTK